MDNISTYNLYKFFPMLRNVFDVPVYDQKPYWVKKTETGYQIVVKALGMTSDDISVEITGDTLSIDGKKMIEAIDYETKIDIRMNIYNIINDIDRVNYNCENGLVYVDLIIKQNTTKKIPISKK